MSTLVDIEIRPAATPEDVARIQSLWDACGLGRAEPDEIDALMENATTALLVAMDAGQAIGTAIASFDGWRAYIYHVAVAPGTRREGLGHRLMAEAERYLTSAGARYVYVTVNQENTEGLALVAATGYLPEGEIVLTKRLATRPA
jgi:ribosomal protein S18 acetylase RimI-like enzyme